MFKNSLLFTHIILTIGILLITILFSFIKFPFSVLFHLLSIIVMTVIYFLVMRTKLKSCLKNFQSTIEEITKNDQTLNNDAMSLVNLISTSIYLNPRQLLEHINTFLLKQNEILEKLYTSRDYIEKNKKLQEIIIRLNHAIVTDKNIESLMEMILEAAISVVKGSSAGSVMVPDNKGMVKYVAAIGMDIFELQKIKLNFKDTFIHRMKKDDEFHPIIIRNKSSFFQKHLDPETQAFLTKAGSAKYPCILNTPIMIGETIYGELSLEGDSSDTFKQDDIRMMKYFTSELAIVIKNMKLINRAFHLSKYDNLTDIYNRNYFEDMATIAFDEASRYNRQLHFVLFDLDDFKRINDNYGHSNGDIVLKKFSETISNSIRGSDVFARYGGDEFIAYLKNSSTKNIEKKITDIRIQFANNPLKFYEEEYTIKFSYGIAEYTRELLSPEELFKKSDKHMYENKNKNKNKIET